MSAGPDRENRGNGKSLGTAACTAIVVGNMVGSGFYLSPAAVAPFGNLAIIAWVIMGAGAVCLGLTFAKLARLVPATGGPYAYTRMAYGDFAGFLIAWGYWISIWASLPVIAIAFAGAVFDLLPGLHNRTMAVVLTLGAIWAVVLVNLRGVKEAGLFAEITTYTKLIPFAAIALVGLFFIDTSNFSEFNPSGKSLLGASAALAPLTMFAFLGLESATVPGYRLVTLPSFERVAARPSVPRRGAGRFRDRLGRARLRPRDHLAVVPGPPRKGLPLADCLRIRARGSRARARGRPGDHAHLGAGAAVRGPSARDAPRRPAFARAVVPE